MDDVKKTYREGEQATKEAWRESDGDVSVADHVGNVGDELRKQAGNAGDAVDGDDKSATGDYDKSATTASNEAWRKADGDESLADKVGNAGDELRDEVTTDR
jgi:hypothetical protein